MLLGLEPGQPFTTDQVLRALLRDAGIDCPAPQDEILRLFVPEDCDGRTLFRFAADHGVQVRHLRASLPTLEDVFATAIGQGSAE